MSNQKKIESSLKIRHLKYRIVVFFHQHLFHFFFKIFVERPGYLLTGSFFMPISLKHYILNHLDKEQHA